MKQSQLGQLGQFPLTPLLSRCTNLFIGPRLPLVVLALLPASFLGQLRKLLADLPVAGDSEDLLVVVVLLQLKNRREHGPQTLHKTVVVVADLVA